MLIYATSFRLKPTDGESEIIEVIARWIGKRTKSYVDPSRLSEGVQELRFSDGSTVTSRSVYSIGPGQSSRLLFCARYSHGDLTVSGRRWVLEVGFRREHQTSSFRCSVVLRTDEVSTRVTTTIQVTRPRLVEDLLLRCKPAGDTPGLVVKQLDQDSAIAFPYEVERTERKYPIVVLSANSEGEFPVDVERIRSVVAGLASIVQIPASVDTFQLQEQVGRRYMAFGGAINIIFPATHVGNAPNYRSTLILPDKIAEIIEDGQSIETEILSAITHRMNLPNSWQHVSLEVVNQAALRQQMHALIQRDSGTTELNEYVELLEAADAELNSKDNSIAQLQQDLEARDLEAEKLQAEIDGLKHSLSGINAKLPAHPNIDGIADLRDAVDQLLGGRPKLAQTLRLFDAMYQDRVRILATAYDAAQASDQAGFVHGKKAFELLSKLAGPYWSALANGQGDQQAKSVFGNSFASREADTLSSAGRKRRTFSYGNELVFMEKHLKHGVKDSAAETLRIHFEWIAAEKLVVIGHCGKHLDF